MKSVELWLGGKCSTCELQGLEHGAKGKSFAGCCCAIMGQLCRVAHIGGGTPVIV